MDPFEILNEREWEMIIDKFDPIDKLNLLATNSQFETPFFLRKKSEWQFHAVLSILFGLPLEDYERIRVSADFNFRDAFLNCRLVSSRTCKVMDKLVQNHWERFKCTLPFLSNEGSSPKFCSRADLLKFFNDFGTRPLLRSPFISRELKVSCIDMVNPHQKEQLDARNQRLSFGNITQLVNCMGKHLLGFIMYVWTSGIQDPYPTKISQILTPLSNVIRLEILFGKASKNQEYSNIRPDRVAAEEPLEPLNLPSLDDLCISGNVMSFPAVGLQFATSCVSQVTSLHVHFSLWKKEYNREGAFPNLECLILWGIIIQYESRSLLYDLFLTMDSPQLELLTFEYCINDPFREEKIASVENFRQTAVDAMQRRFPNGVCESESEILEDLMNFSIYII